jgi:hypothetical protein
MCANDGNELIYLFIIAMQDDSSLNNSPNSKTKVQRSQSSITDSFRMAASVLQGGSGPSRRATNLVVQGKSHSS